MKKLTRISIDAFHTDFIVAGRKTKGGPPGYDSTEFHEQMIKDSFRFYKILLDDSTIGGFWFNKESSEKAFLYRIFVDPKFHNMGVGSLVFDFLFQHFPNFKSWSLKTPIWNTRTSKFYVKLGFEITEKTDKFLFFTKRMESK
ncbi:GNAT family N-acetyltransferase [bacterium]|nr:GNAT family N-acetyltransferase [bacterium]